MPRIHYGSQPEGPDEGQYDPRKGAQGYSAIVASFGALAVTAIVVVFSVGTAASPQNLALATGLLAIGVFASFLGSFGLAAVGAEDHPTANLSAVITFIAVPVVISFVAILGAFEVLAAIYINESTTLFALITGAGGIAGVAFTSFAVGDSVAMHPTTLQPAEFDQWRRKQWIKNQEQAYSDALRIAVVTAIPVAIAMIIRLFGVRVDIDLAGANWVVGIGIFLALLGTAMSLKRAVHPVTGNDQHGLKQWEAWSAVTVISLYSTVLILVLPA